MKRAGSESRMLKNTFCHVPGVGPLKEKRFWDSGIYAWDDLRETPGYCSSGRKIKCLTQVIDRSFEELERNNPKFFAEYLPSNQQWRLFPSFRSSLAYLDIETTGLDFRRIDNDDRSLRRALRIPLRQWL